MFAVSSYHIGGYIPLIANVGCVPLNGTHSNTKIDDSITAMFVKNLYGVWTIKTSVTCTSCCDSISTECCQPQLKILSSLFLKRHFFILPLKWGHLANKKHTC